jgi:cobalt/nickel transport system ATP-binding protein
MNQSPILEMKELSFAYPDGTKALNGVNLSLPAGKKIAFVGGNGAGKSTLFQIFNGIRKPQKGEYRFEGRKISFSRSDLSNLRKKIGLVFQEPDNQIFSAQVFEEISFGPMNLKLTPAEVNQRVEAAMLQTGIGEHRHKPPHLLSYGQKKRVTIASVLSMYPAVIVLDEPTSGLDPGHARSIMALLEELNRQGKTIIISTHDVNLAYSFVDWVIVMNNGTVLQSGSPREIFSDENLLTSVGLEKPWPLKVFEKTKRLQGLALPLNEEELLKMLEDIG